MLKRLLLAGVMTGLALPALAQSGQGSAGFLSQMPPEAMRLSKLRGVDVIGSDVTAIGDIDDVLVSRDGKRAGVLIDVGGFLGIGGKTVAVPFEAILWNFEASPTDGPSSSNTGIRADGGGLQTQSATANDPRSPGIATTGSVAARPENASSPGQAGAQGGSSGMPTTAGTNTPGPVGSGTPAATPGTGGASAAGGPGPLTPMAQGSGNDTAGRSGMESAMGGAAPQGTATVSVGTGSAPARAVLRMTTQELRDAPEWKGER